jgi:hypothetical protein
MFNVLYRCNQRFPCLGEGGVFGFSVVCNDRLSKLVAQQHGQQTSFWESPSATHLMVRHLKTTIRNAQYTK